MNFSAVRVGDCLPPLEIPVTTKGIVASAIATRDFHPVHHDVQAANDLGSPTIFMNILASNGYVERFVTDWTGPEVLLKSVRIKLGAPNYAGDVMVMTGRVTICEPESHCVEVTVKGVNSLGEHLTGKVVLVLP